jgi:ADP-heptose:LPS heptosyltransferase
VKHIVVIRFSALGDIAMTIPVIREVLAQHPGIQITYVSTGFVAPLFAGIDRLQFIAADLKGTHKGLRGLYRLSKTIKAAGKIDAVADLHEVLRTKVLRNLLRFTGARIAVLDKGRKEKAELTRVNGKKLHPLKPTVVRYAEVFARLSFPVVLHHPQFKVREKIADRKIRIGVAPFAKHAEKRYPLEKMEAVVALLDADGDKEILLFGSREEAEQLQAWQERFSNVRVLAGTMPFASELETIAGLDLMVSMDSANMHLASLYGVPVVSIWGSTHPFAGFYGWGQDPRHAVQTDLYCRPCSVFGNRPCYRGDLACLQSITPQMVYDRVVQALAM